MANKRMFSKQIVQTDAFMEMPISSQLLYFHLAMEADDEGFVSSPRRIMKMVGSSPDDYKVLVSKRFIIPFESGVCVIKHWLIHNTIRMDRFNPTTYKTEKELLITKENKAYTELATTGKPSGNQRLPQVKLSKVKLIKVKLSEYENVLLTKEELEKLKNKIGEKETLELIEELGGYLESTGKRYKSHYATIQNWSKRKKGERNYKSKKITTI